MVWIIILTILVLSILLLRWMWNSLRDIENSKKATFMVAGLIVMYILTFIIFNISKSGVEYKNKESMNMIRTVLVAVFTLVNSYIVLPFTFKRLDRIDKNEMEASKLKKSIIIILAVILVISVFEVSYLNSVQQGIMSISGRF